ncbi:cation:proton antiporter [Butyricicoccus sp. Marseille-Q5471]|uniref:cation:proton antiporter n=1 Tax=Butyricicoccus sp. Marseille-Q5471 TaxID=3039493 RepID=UPI0024BCE871|nr:cation:proton antiporter [Butyricicoccus sp. Marseille-Q5471]
MNILLILRLAAAIGIAFLVGKLVSKIKLPAILGWLLAGMLLGPHALGLLDNAVLETAWYQTSVHVLECAVGLMIGTELVWKKIKRSGAQIIITTLTQSLGTFLVVTLVFGVVFWLSDIPLYLAAIFGGIALATAPAPALSIVNEFQTDGPVTRTLIPMAALDDMVGVAVFFSVISVVSATVPTKKLPVYMIALVIVLPLAIGAVVGLLAGVLLKKKTSKRVTLLCLIGTLLLSAGIGLMVNALLFQKSVLNFMLIGMAFSTAFANMISPERLEEIMSYFQPILGFSMVVVILNLGAPLDYHLILGAGLFTAVYILARAAGKYGGAYLGARVTHAPDTVRKYLGLTLLPHSGVSLVFTGIAVSVLSGPAPECAQIIQGTIAAAAVINEVIAVILSKKAFEWAGEFQKSEGSNPADCHLSSPE